MNTNTPDLAKLLARNSPLIGETWLRETRAGTVTHIDPSTGQAVGTALLGGPAEIALAVEAAQKAQRQWMSMSGARRTRILFDFSAAVQRHEKTLAQILALDAGVPISLGNAIGVAWIEYFAGYADKVGGATTEPSNAAGYNFTRKEPYGVIGVIIPWNHPLIATCQVAIPAIAAGNAVVLKPPSITPYTALKLGEIALEAGMPPGLLCVVPGDADAGEALIAHPGVSKVSFTGGVATAKHVMAAAARVVKPLFLELGGKSANLMFADADLATQVPFSFGFCMGLSGQGCALPTRLLVEEQIYESVLAGLVQTAAYMKVGPALDPQTNIGPVINEAACNRILQVIERAQTQGEGRLIHGGRRAAGALAGGYFIEPAIFADVHPDTRLAREEVFGPVLAVTPFKTEAEALAIANDSELGLAAYVQTSNLDRAHRLAAQLKAGYVCINGFSNMEPSAPFGGYKQSGFGRIGGREGMEEYLQTKNVFIASH